jgi:hypothetical protein
MKSHYRMKDLEPEHIKITTIEKQQAVYRAKQKGSPILPNNKTELKNLIDTFLSKTS